MVESRRPLYTEVRVRPPFGSADKVLELPSIGLMVVEMAGLPSGSVSILLGPVS